jgi:hypothetical protein
VLISQLALARLRTSLQRNLPVCLMYLPVHLFFALWVSSFTFLPLKAAATGWAAFLLPYYLVTSLGEPHHTGATRCWRESGASSARRRVRPAACGLPSAGTAPGRAPGPARLPRRQ